VSPRRRRKICSNTSCVVSMLCDMVVLGREAALMRSERKVSPVSPLAGEEQPHRDPRSQSRSGVGCVRDSTRVRLLLVLAHRTFQAVRPTLSIKAPHRRILSPAVANSQHSIWQLFDRAPGPYTRIVKLFDTEVS
jgi:hypothetical protein